MDRDHGLVCLHSIIPVRWRQTQRSAEEIEKLICLVHENEILYQHQIFVCFKRHSEIILKFIFVFPQRRYELVKHSHRRFNNIYLVHRLFHLLFLNIHILINFLTGALTTTILIVEKIEIDFLIV